MRRSSPPLYLLLSAALISCDGQGAQPGHGMAEDPPGPQVPFVDDGTAVNPVPAWGEADCRSGTITRVATGGAPRLKGHPKFGSPAYRRMTTSSSPDSRVQRCELGRNEHRYGEGGGRGTAALFSEGDQRTILMAARLPSEYRLDADEWQVVMQMKQTQPAANGGGTPVLSLEARGDAWRLMQSTSSGLSFDTRELWSAPAKLYEWTLFAFDVTYSQDPAVGSVEVRADLNGDGDFGDPSEQSAAISTYTLKREIEGGDPGDGIEPGESIPSHLRLGLYHDPSLRCSPRGGCSVDIDNVAVSDSGA